ncbi:MAG: VanZ family protein [Gemmatirosa sp.]
MPSSDRSDARWRARRIAARAAYVLVVLVATWTGLRFEFDPTLARLRLARGLSPGFRPNDVLDAVRNVALFAGLGGVWLATGNPTRLLRGVAVATVVGTLLSVVAEAAQLFSPSRMASVLDLLTNGGGAMLGAATVAFAIAVVAARRARTDAAVVPHLLVAGPYLGACLLEAFSAWGRPDRVPGAWGGPGARWRASIADFWTHPHALPMWSDLLLFAPAGFLATRVLVERGVAPWAAAAGAAVAGTLTWAAAELMRGFSGADLRPWAVVLHALATALGAALAATLAGRSPADALARLHRSARAYVAIVLLWNLRPFRPVTSLGELADKLTLDAVVPLRALAGLWSLHSVADIAIGFCLFLPVGAWFAVRTGADGRVRAPWPGLALALGVEVAQLTVRGRYFDITDVLVQAAGVLVGWAIVRRADARRDLLLAPARAPGRATHARSRAVQSALG